MGTCTKHAEKVHCYIQHIAGHHTRSAKGGGLWVAAVRLSCQYIDAIVDHVSASATHEANHRVVPVAWENDAIPNLSCKTCNQFLTIAVEDAYLDLFAQHLSRKKQSPRS